MAAPDHPSPASPIGPELEDTLAAVETGLAALAEALRARDTAAIDGHADALHRSLAEAVRHFTTAAQMGPVEPALRRRLASASGLVAAQRESLARATAALDRAIDVLMPRDAPRLYAPHGAHERTGWGNSLRA